MSRTIVIGLLAATAGFLVVGTVQPGTFDGVPRMVPDFGVYYACASVNWHGHNPYEGEAPEAAQRAINPAFTPLRANSGPFTLAALTPFTAFDYGTARFAWFTLELALLVLSGGVLWRLYDGLGDILGWLLAVSGYAALQALILGQLSPFVLAGLVGFVALERRGWPVLGGMCLGVLLVKPQNQLVLFAVGTVWLIDRRQWRVFLGASLTAAVMAAVAVAGNPATFAQYVHALTSNPPREWQPPLPASVLRMVFGLQHYWLTFVPLLAGLAWAGWQYAKHRRNWSWTERMPSLLLVSYLASPYGWAYDHLVFLFPLIQVAAAMSRKPGPGLLLLLGVWLAMDVYYFALLIRNVPEFHWVWVAPTAALGYWWWSRRVE
jgi:hypothetical protein